MTNATPPRLVEYGEVGKGDWSKTTTVAQGTDRWGRLWTLEHHTPGYERADHTNLTIGYERAATKASWTDEVWSVTTRREGVTYGTRFNTEEKARKNTEDLTNVPTPVVLTGQGDYAKAWPTEGGVS